MKALAAGIATAFALLVRYMVSLHSYSGKGIPPMFGDYEAQRHWMEIVINLPVGDWYRNTADNDLLYWGLDYPPLSAYLAYAFGRVAKILEPASVALFDSRGYESASSKTMMRLSVVLTDMLVYIPAVWLFCRTYYKGSRHQTFLLLVILLQPALVLIDHGHFQYNNVSIGFVLWGLLAISHEYDMVGSFFFCLSLNFKTMSLYMAPAFFFYLLARCRYHKSPLVHLVKLGIAVVSTFALHWLPFCVHAASGVTCVEGLQQGAHSILYPHCAHRHT
jgi:alpha-1,3-glucosyltransferase